MDSSYSRLQGFGPDGSANPTPTKSPVEDFLDQHASAQLFSTFLTLRTKAGLIEIDVPSTPVNNAGRLTTGAVDNAIKNSGQDLTWYAHCCHIACSLG